MPVELKDIEQVAETLDQKFNEFKSVNDKKFAGIEQEKSALSQTVETLGAEVKSLQATKDDLTEQLAQFELKQNRPGATGLTKEATEHKEAFGLFMRKGEDDGLSQLQAKALNVGTDADGGFAVPESLDQNILKLLRDATPMRQLCNVMQMGGESYKKLVSINGASSGWVGEDSERSATGTPSLKSISPYMGEIYANPQATQTMLDDAFFNAEMWLSEEVQMEFSEKENLAFTLGDGVNKPKGFLAYATAAESDKTRAFGTLEHKLTENSGDVTGDDVIKLIYALKAGYRQGASFTGTSDLLSRLMTLKDGNGQYIWRPGLEIGQTSTLRGYNFVENEDQPEVAAGALALSFGNFQRGYTIVDRMGTRVLRDPYTNKPFVGFYTTKRVGGFVTDSQAIKHLKIAA